jgi:hypothetical protein
MSLTGCRQQQHQAAGERQGQHKEPPPYLICEYVFHEDISGLLFIHAYWCMNYFMMCVPSTLIRVLSTGYSSIKYNANWQNLARLPYVINMKIYWNESVFIRPAAIDGAWAG